MKPVAGGERSPARRPQLTRDTRNLYPAACVMVASLFPIVAEGR